MYKFYILAFLLSFLSSCKAEDRKLIDISVLNSEFQVINVVENDIDLSIFQKHWDELIPIEETPNYKWTHKIDIKSEGTHNGRWLYNSEGYVARLNKTFSTLYKVKDVEEFNEFILKNSS